jgi:hypothetical protein
VKIGGLITLAVVMVLAGGLVVLQDPARWPAPESPPQQGEAVDPASLGNRPVHATAALERLVREPQNAWSNLAFVAGGALLATTAGRRLARWTGVVLIVVGVGSFLYHASASRELRQVDVAAMYWLFLISTVLCSGAVWPLWRVKADSAAVVIFVCTLLIAVALTLARNVTVAGLKPFSLHVATALTAAVVILSLAETARRAESLAAALRLLGIVTTFGIAAACQTWDRPGGRFYHPTAAIQAHAVWHMLAAVVFVASIKMLDRAGLPVQVGMTGRSRPSISA